MGGRRFCFLFCFCFCVWVFVFISSSFFFFFFFAFLDAAACVYYIMWMNKNMQLFTRYENNTQLLGRKCQQLIIKTCMKYVKSFLFVCLFICFDFFYLFLFVGRRAYKKATFLNICLRILKNLLSFIITKTGHTRKMFRFYWTMWTH